MLVFEELFSEEFYLSLYPDVAQVVQAGQFSSGLDHYLQFGEAEGRQPDLFFSEAYYRGLYPDVAIALESGEFTSGLDHYLLFGQLEGRETTLVFSEDFYRQNHPDVVAAFDPVTGSLVSGLEHYLNFGEAENRDPFARTVVFWDEVAQQAVRNTAPGPTVASRAYGMVHTAMFDAWASYDPVAIDTQIEPQSADNPQRPLEENTILNKSEAMSHSAYRVLLNLFPDQKSLFDQAMTQLGYHPTQSGTARDVGASAARALLDFRGNDGSNQLNNYADNTGYESINTPDQVNDLNHWQPLRQPLNDPNGTVQRFLTPQWGTVMPFALTSGDQFRPPAPIEAGTPLFEERAQEVLDFSANLTDEQKMIAEFWEDGPGTSFPPGTWMTFGQFISDRDTHTLDEDIVLFFALGNAVFDAGIAAWEAKRFYDYVRPITAIHTLFSGQEVSAWGGPGQGTQLIDGGNWQPYQRINSPTPPFPEYVSGHSTFSSAAAEVLLQFTGSDNFGDAYLADPGSSFLEPGITPAEPVTLFWPTFSDAADESGMSRLYGGIHFREGDLNGRQLGREVGEIVWQKVQSYVSGTAMNGTPG
ncbi:MAG: vanadium-dependent haloperoxidase [Oscillatoriales cyanobacterium RM2_1_1]|nr:vanadium-dependent haloperoxidase [Oscillatoriales cyanobacterium SM2_3_0]NJO46429.1 vanadium-dependent haloperoxidase [Oscillatoriales cyanobacterium RM2_1_1]